MMGWVDRGSGIAETKYLMVIPYPSRCCYAAILLVRIMYNKYYYLTLFVVRPTLAFLYRRTFDLVVLGERRMLEVYMY